MQSSTGSNYVVRILSTLDREKLKPSSSVALHRHSNSLVDILPPEADSSIAMLGAHEKPDVTYADVGGLDMQKQEIREAVELPLTHFDLYRQIGEYMLFSVVRALLTSSRHRPTSRCPSLRSSRHWQDYAGQSSGQQHNGKFHSRRGLRVRAKISGRGTPYGARCFPNGKRKFACYNLHR